MVNAIFTQLNVDDPDLNRVQSNISLAFNNIASEMPIGSVILFGGPSTITVNQGTTTRAQPNDQGTWLICNGRSLPLNDFRPLFSVLSFTYGGSVTSGIFSIPSASAFGFTATMLVKSQ